MEFFYDARKEVLHPPHNVPLSASSQPTREEKLAVAVINDGSRKLHRKGIVS